MNIELNLNAESYVRHDKIITLPDERVAFLFKSACYAIGELLITVKVNNKEKQYKLQSEGGVDITDLITQACEVNMTAQFIINGNVAKTWQIEPLCVREIGGGFEAIPEIEHLKQRISVLEKAVTELSELTI